MPCHAMTGKNTATSDHWRRRWWWWGIEIAWHMLLISTCSFSPRDVVGFFMSFCWSHRRGGRSRPDQHDWEKLLFLAKSQCFSCHCPQPTYHYTKSLQIHSSSTPWDYLLVVLYAPSIAPSIVSTLALRTSKSNAYKAFTPLGCKGGRLDGLRNKVVK